MARIRTIKPTFWEDEDIATLSLRARLLFIATWNYADDEGLLRWTPDYIKASVFMYEALTLKQVEAVMAELEQAGHVFPYRGGRSQQRLAYIPKFLTHQRINRPQPSKLPPPSLQMLEVRRMYGNRDGWICHICKHEIPAYDTPAYCESAPHERLSLDHVHAKSLGGVDHPSNIRASHQGCNASKGNRPWVTDPVNDSVNDSVNESSLEGNREEGREEGGADDRSSARALMAPGCAPHLIEEATQNLVSLCDVWPIAQVDAAIQQLIDDRRRFQWPSKLDAALTAILGDPPATAPANVLDDTQRAQMAIAERGLDQVRAAINDPAVAQDPEERKRILAEQRAARGAA